jgi:hypothetical protein
MIVFTFILFFYFLFLNRKVIYNFLQKINKKYWLILFTVFLFAILLRWVIPYQQYVFLTDETFYVNAANHFFEFDYGKGYEKSIGWPFMLAVFFKIFSADNLTVFATSIFFGALTIFPLFLLTYSISKNKFTSLLSASLFTMIPYHIFWSSSGDSRATSLFFTALTLYFCFLYASGNQRKMLWLAMTGLAITVQFRPENIILLPFFFLILKLFSKEPILKNWKKYALPVALFFLLISFNLTTIFNHYYLYSETRLPHSWPWLNFSFFDIYYYFKTLFGGSILPFSWLFLFVLGLFFLFKKNRKIFILLSSWFFGFVLLYFIFWMDMPFIFKNNNNISPYWLSRGMMSIYLPLSIFSAYGAYYLIFLLKKYFSKNKVIYCFTLTISSVLILFPLFPIYQNLKAGNLYKKNILETKIINDLPELIPDNSLLVTPKPRVITFSKKNIKTLKTKQFLNYPLKNKYENKIFFLDDYFCEKDNNEKSCNLIKDEFDLEIYKSYIKNDKNYTLYKLSY